MIDYARFYYLYNSTALKIARILFFGFFLLGIVNSLYINQFVRLPFFLFFCLLILEIFVYFKIGKVKPKKIKKVEKNNLDLLDAFTLLAIRPFLPNNFARELIFLMNQKQVQFILDKSDIKKEEVGFFDVDSGAVSSLAFTLAKRLNGDFVTTMDVFSSYLLLSEEKSKLLFKKNLKKDDLLDILYWGRKANPWEEKKHKDVLFWGKGLAEDWVTGWTVETQKYIVDFSSEVVNNKPFLLGRKEEYTEVKEAVYRNKSTVLVGEPGSGKTALVASFAYESFVGNLKGSLYHQRIFQLLVDQLVAGAQNHNEIEQRMDSIIDEVSHANNIIIFIPNLQNILGSASFDLDLSGVLLPYLKKGAIKIISTATPSSFKKLVEPMSSFLDVFDVIRLEEPDKDTVKQIILEKTLEIEKKNNLSISYRAALAALSLANKYLQNRVMPGAAIRLLEDTVSEVALNGKKIVEEQDVLNKVKNKTKIMVGPPLGKEKELLLNLEDEMHKYIIDQKDAVFAISEAMRRLRSGVDIQDKPISFLFLGPTGVGKTATAKALASLYFGENRMIRVDMSEYAEKESVKRLLGEGEEEGFIDRVYHNPFSLILLDEFEKADTAVRDLFLQVLDDGRLTDNKGRLVSFANAIIIATSNAASEFIREEVEKAVPAGRQGDSFGKAFKLKLLNFLQEKGIFKPELLNRFDDVIVFKPLGKEEVVAITRILLNDLSKRMLEKDIAVGFDDKVIGKIVKEGFDKEYGARPIRRFIQDNIEDLLAKKMLRDEIKRGDKVFFSTDNVNIITVSVS